MDRELKAAFSSFGHTKALGDRLDLADGTAISRVTVDPIIGAYRRMVRDLEFDVCELAPVTYMLAKQRGAAFTALPIFLERDFHYSDLFVRRDSGIDEPKDLEGHRFGVRAYTVTTGVWVRAMLRRRFGVDCRNVEWVVDDEDHITGLQLPVNVTKLPDGESIADEFASGKIQAALRGIAGAGRRGSPLSAWSTTDISGDEASPFKPLIAQPTDSARADYKETGVYPFHRLIVIKDDVARANPDLPRMVFDKFVQAKREYLRSLDAMGTPEGADLKYKALGADVLGGDPLPYGIAKNRSSIDDLALVSISEGFLPNDVDAVSMFYGFEE